MTVLTDECLVCMITINFSAFIVGTRYQVDCQFIEKASSYNTSNTKAHLLLYSIIYRHDRHHHYHQQQSYCMSVWLYFMNPSARVHKAILSLVNHQFILNLRLISCVCQECLSAYYSCQCGVFSKWYD